jgi:hypothetical protein
LIEIVFPQTTLLLVEPSNLGHHFVRVFYLFGNLSEREKMAMHFPGQLPERFHPFFGEQLFFFSLPQKLVVRGLILEKFLGGIMGFIYFILCSILAFKLWGS